MNSIHKNLLEFNDKGKKCIIVLFLFLIALSSSPSFKNLNKKYYGDYYYSNINEQIINDIMNNSIRISFIGDLLLLKDQVISAKNNIDGPNAGNTTSYSTSNYGDGIPLYLNFPDEFAESVKNAGINLVTTTNNHLLDKNIKGAMRTLDLFDKYNISHVGSYRNKEEKDKIFIVNVKGIKIAVLAYTSKINKIKMQDLYKKYNYLTRIIPKNDNKYYEEIYNEIKNDFTQVKKESPDIIIVLAHMGTQFLHKENVFQDKWNKIFTNLGANIILGGHSHVVKPLQYINNTFIANSPGNFANSYIKNRSDIAAIIDIYINKQTKKVIGASAIPMYTKEIRKKYFSAIPIYDIMKDNLVTLNKNERKRVQQIQLMTTKVLVGKEIGINNIKKEFFFINNSYYDMGDNKFCYELNEYSKSEVFKTIEKSNSITFIGDSITRGLKNGFHPWYEPILKCFKNKKIINFSR